MFAYLLYTRVRVKRFPPSVAGKISTVLQAVTLGAVIGVNAFVPGLLVFAHIMFHIALLITLISGADYIRRAKRMLLESAAA
jgi:phosphatidylglycerophosphate synthase